MVPLLLKVQNADVVGALVVDALVDVGAGAVVLDVALEAVVLDVALEAVVVCDTVVVVGGVELLGGTLVEVGNAVDELLL